MGLSNDLISQFVKITKDDKKAKTEATLYGTAVVGSDGTTYVKLDGSDIATPVERTANVNDGERVTVRIANHTATITGNISSPAARTGDVEDVSAQITEFEHIMADSVTADDIQAITAIIESLKASLGEFYELEAVQAEIEKLIALYAELEYLSAQDMEAINAIIEHLTAMFAEFENVSAEQLEAINANIQNLQAYNAEFVYVSAEQLSAVKADIQELDAEKISVEDIDATVANIVFANIDEAAIRKFLADWGIVGDLTVDNVTVTDALIGVNIVGDTIKGGVISGTTVHADTLILRGEDGLYYKMNVEGGATVTEQITDEDLQNGLSGTIIVANSITADKISVSDLVAFDATIGGFNISDHAIYSGVKSSVDNAARGLYMDRDGQLYLGDSNNFIKYYRDVDGNYKLAIALGGKTVEETVQEAVDSVQVGARNLIRNSENLIFENYSFGDDSYAAILGTGRIGYIIL